MRTIYLTRRAEMFIRKESDKTYEKIIKYRIIEIERRKISKFDNGYIKRMEEVT